ncbi:hypothetical protein DFP72DRAFT_1070536 [Ephemerocybe angulata]|uniref:Uncharacterized protein n=1 Tax=Ephemerocybe angulata TaxID=980116 RepID=A0A8H6M4U8_9AGAR|nr:hypothetical protein DFP72DRAFT_1070536 [Tulosesus angulatus]
MANSLPVSVLLSLFHCCSTLSGLRSLSAHFLKIYTSDIPTNMKSEDRETDCAVTPGHQDHGTNRTQIDGIKLHHDALPFLAWYTNKGGYVSDMGLSATSKPYNQHHYWPLAAASNPYNQHHLSSAPASLVPLVTLRQVSSSLVNTVDRWRRRLFTGLWVSIPLHFSIRNMMLTFASIHEHPAVIADPARCDEIRSRPPFDTLQPASRNVGGPIDQESSSLVIVAGESMGGAIGMWKSPRCPPFPRLGKPCTDAIHPSTIIYIRSRFSMSRLSCERPAASPACSQTLDLVHLCTSHDDFSSLSVARAMPFDVDSRL